MSTDDTCCTCASILNAKPPSYVHDRLTSSASNEKPAITNDEKAKASSDPNPARANVLKPGRRLVCCNRVICASCIAKNPRFDSYCPFCQISTTPTSLPQGLRDPPAYKSRPPSPKLQPQAAADSTQPDAEQPPAYSAVPHQPPQPQDTTHYLRPTDTLQSLSLAYGVPTGILRAHNSLYSDHLLSARHNLSIPASHYAGPSLSPTPLDSEKETERKAHIRRFMVAAKCADYDIAELYLSQADGSVDGALDSWREDERWERENPFQAGKMGARRAPPNPDANVRRGRFFGGGGLTGQLG